MSSSKSYILDNLPTDHDSLDFTPCVETLVDVCKTASTPLTIGVFGTWGSGKTSLMRMARKKLPKDIRKGQDDKRIVVKTALFFIDIRNDYFPGSKMELGGALTF